MSACIQLHVYYSCHKSMQNWSVSSLWTWIFTNTLEKNLKFQPNCQSFISDLIACENNNNNKILPILNIFLTYSLRNIKEQTRGKPTKIMLSFGVAPTNINLCHIWVKKSESVSQNARNVLTFLIVWKGSKVFKFLKDSSMINKYPDQISSNKSNVHLLENLFIWIFFFFFQNTCFIFSESAESVIISCVDGNYLGNKSQYILNSLQILAPV